MSIKENLQLLVSLNPKREQSAVLETQRDFSVHFYDLRGAEAAKERGG